MFKIFVAGFDRYDNPIVKYLTKLGMAVTHLSKSDNRSIPILDAAVVCTENCSHDLMNRVKDLYKSNNKEVFYGGNVSFFRPKFEEKFVEPVRSLAKNTPSGPFCGWFICTILNKGDKFTAKKVKELLEAYKIEVSDANVSNSLVRLRNREVIAMDTLSNRKNVFKGLNRGYLKYLEVRGFPITGLDKKIADIYDADLPPLEEKHSVESEATLNDGGSLFEEPTPTKEEPIFEEPIELPPLDDRKPDREELLLDVLGSLESAVGRINDKLDSLEKRIAKIETGQMLPDAVLGQIAQSLKIPSQLVTIDENKLKKLEALYTLMETFEKS